MPTSHMTLDSLLTCGRATTRRRVDILEHTSNTKFSGACLDASPSILTQTTGTLLHKASLWPTDPQNLTSMGTSTEAVCIEMHHLRGARASEDRIQRRGFERRVWNGVMGRRVPFLCARLKHKQKLPYAIRVHPCQFANSFRTLRSSVKSFLPYEATCKNSSRAFVGKTRRTLRPRR